MKKKGFTLVEFMVGLCILSILGFMQIRIFMKQFKNYSTQMNSVLNYSYLNTALNFIETNVTDIGQVKVENNVIRIVDKKKEKNEKEIKKVDTRLVIIHKEFTNDTLNVILRHVKEFHIDQRGCRLFITVEDEEGRKCNRFIRIKSQ